MPKNGCTQSIRGRRRPAIQARLGRVGLSLAAALAVIPAGSGLASAAELETRLDGRVISIEDAGEQSSATLLAQRGLRVGTAVAISLTFEDSVTPVAEGVGTSYSRGIVAMAVSGGLYQTSYARRTGGLIPSSVLCVDDDDEGQGPVDRYSVQVPTANESADILRGGAGEVPPTMALTARDATGRAMADESLIQDVLLFPAGSVTLVITGAGGTLTIAVGEDTTAAETLLCRRGQIAAASKFTRSYFACRARRASKPAVKDLGGVKEQKCITKARSKFETAFRKAATKAERKGGTCVLGAEAAADSAQDLVDAMADLTDALVVDADRLDKIDRALRGRLLKAASAQASKDLRAYAKHAKKPNPAKLATQLVTNRVKTVNAAGKAIDKAVAGGIDIGALSATSLADSVRALVQAFVASIGGA